MSQVAVFEVPTDTGQFTPDQLQPTTACSLAMQGWAEWLRSYLVPFRALVYEHHVGVVIVTLVVEYLAPLRFADTPSLRVAARVTEVGRGRLLRLVVDIASGGSIAVRVQATLRVVALGTDASLAAMPHRLPGDLLGQLATEGSKRTVDRPVKEALAHLGSLTPAGEGRTDFVLHRHLCEVADQWSAIQIPALVSAARERLLLGGDGHRGRLSVGLGQPLGRIAMELRRPLFLFDEFWITTAAYDLDPMRFVHRVFSGSGVGESHGTIVETLASRGPAA